MTRKNEIWKSVIDPMDREPYPAYYVSNKGRVKSRKGLYPTIMATWYQSKGYECATLYTGRYPDGRKRYRTHTVGSLVLRAFVGPRPKGKQVTYVDGDRENNNLKNLKWCTRSESWKLQKKRGTAPTGERNGRSKLTEKRVSKIKEALKGGAHMEKLGRRYGVSGSTIAEIRDGKTWRHVK